MSKAHSQMQPTPSPAADSEADRAARAKAVAEAGELIASFGIFGIIWLDDALMVRDIYGKLVEFIAKGQPLSDSVLPVVGLESEIQDLIHRPRYLLELPAVGFATENETIKKLNFTFFRNEIDGHPMAIAYRSSSQTDLELELSKQIRARLMAESEVMATSKALARANSDLESFAAVVSHDLKAPLRHMRYLADTLAVQCQDAATSSTLAAIKAQTLRMSSMLSTLLDYSSLGRKYEAIEPVDSRALVQAIATSLHQPGTTIIIDGHWPVIATLKAPLDLVLRNLIGNALQHHDLLQGRVTVSCVEETAGLVISIADDGPGIDVKHHDAIFLPFRTLAPDDTSNSTGMGLAMVKRTVEAAGGTIAVHSTPDRQRGTTFTVHWPKCMSLA